MFRKSKTTDDHGSLVVFLFAEIMNGQPHVYLYVIKEEV